MQYRGGSGKEPGSGNRFRETGFRTRGIAKVPGSAGCVREVSKVSVFDGFDGLGSIPEVWTEPVLEPGVREPEVLRRFRVPEIPIPRFRK